MRSQVLQELDTRVEYVNAIGMNFKKLAESFAQFQWDVEFCIFDTMILLVHKEEEMNQRLHELHAKIHQ